MDTIEIIQNNQVIEGENKNEEIARIYIDPINKYINIPLEYILKDAIRRKAIYQVQFADYKSDEWAIPSELTENRAAILLTDGSVRKIRIEFEV
jgi:cell fate regulator YaaT (PSP1 superfamily)